MFSGFHFNPLKGSSLFAGDPCRPFGSSWPGSPGGRFSRPRGRCAEVQRGCADHPVARGARRGEDVRPIPAIRLFGARRCLFIFSGFLEFRTFFFWGGGAAILVVFATQCELFLPTRNARFLWSVGVLGGWWLAHESLELSLVCGRVILYPCGFYRDNGD